MKFKIYHLLICSLMLTCSSRVQAKPEPSALFGDHAVLQRDAPVNIWGKADPGEKVKVRFLNRAAEAVTNATGHWFVTLPALMEGMTGELEFEGSNEKVISSDVIVGDVWLCSGQSNMEWTLKKSDNAKSEAATADFPAIRHFKVLPASNKKLQTEIRGKWVVCRPNTVLEFTAIGYYLAKDLYQRSKVPQGLINSTWGGTRIESWLSQEALGSNKALSVVMERWNRAAAAYPAAKVKYDQAMEKWNQEKAEAEKQKIEFKKPRPRAPAGNPEKRGMPSSVYNAMIHPLWPCTTRAVIWYQGEANWKYPPEYKNMLLALIKDWRVKSGKNELPFIVVQLPRYGHEGTKCWPIIREGQAAACEALAHTSLLVTMDLGDPELIHPTNKQDFGARLAKLIRRDVLEEKLVASGPEIVSATMEVSRARIKLAHAGNVVLQNSPDFVGAFELSGEDRKFYPAKAVLEGGDILVHSEQVPNPVACRYAWRDAPHPILYNKEGLPAAPFRSDDWEDQ